MWFAYRARNGMRLVIFLPWQQKETRTPEKYVCSGHRPKAFSVEALAAYSHSNKLLTCSFATAWHSWAWGRPRASFWPATGPDKGRECGAAWIRLRFRSGPGPYGVSVGSESHLHSAGAAH